MPTLYRKSFGIWVPDKRLTDNRGFINPGIIGAVAGARRQTGGATPEYMGNCNSDGTPLVGYSFDFYNSYTFYNNHGTLTFTCPGSGSRTVTSLGLYARTRGSPHSNIRLGVYDTSLNLLFEGSAAILVNSTEQWWSHTSFTGTPSLTGGTSYIIACTFAGALASFAQITGATNSSKYYAGDSTGGMPATLSSGSTISIKQIVRAYMT